MSLEKTDALVIRDMDYRETSKIYEVFTPAHGSMRLIAKGIKRRHQRCASSLQPFSHARLTYYHREPSAMGILREFEVVEPFIYLRGDLVRLGCAYVFMEVLARGSGAKTEPSFRLALRFLRDLKAAARPLDLSICFFYRLMALLGYRPSLERCIRCTANERLMGFEIARGGALCEQCLRLRAEGATQLDSGTIKVLQRCLAMPLGSLASLRLSPRQAELLLPLFLAMVGHYLESEIKSARFLHQVLNSTEPRRKKQ